jgi:hypothetical protein
MITSSSGYECLDVSAYADMINGDILPARIAAGKDSSRIRIEDFLFLREAYLQRLNWNVEVSPVQPAVSRWIKLGDITRYGYFTSGTISSGRKWYPQDSTLRDDFVYGGTSGSMSFSVDDFVVGGDWGFVDDGLDWAVSGVLAKDVLLRRYNNMEQLSRVAPASFGLSSVIDSIAITSTTMNEQGVTTGTSTNVVTSGFGNRDLYYCSSGGNYRAVITCKQNLLTAPWAKSAWLCVVMRVTHSSNGGYVGLRFACPIANGVIHSPDINGACQRAAAAFGAPYFAGPTYSKDNVRIRFQTLFLVVDNDFSAEVSSTGWKYPDGV